MIEPTLLEAYLNTTYEVYWDEKIIKLRIGEFNSKLEELLKVYDSKSWIFITAYNPYSKKLSTQENYLRHYQLVREFSGYMTFVGVGKPDDESWEPESSILVLDLPDKIVDYLAGKYEQNAVVSGKIGQSPYLRISPQPCL